MLGEDNQYKHEINLTMAIPKDNFRSKLIMINNAEVDLQIEKRRVRGSVIDIDVAQESELNFNSLYETVEKAHTEEKALFFSLLSPDFLRSLNPMYD